MSNVKNQPKIKINVSKPKKETEQEKCDEVSKVSEAPKTESRPEQNALIPP